MKLGTDLYPSVRIVLVIGLVSLILLTLNIGGYSIYALDEAKNAECAREMWERGDWIVPTFNYDLRTDKPPLHYYAMIVAYQFFGVNEFAARIFSGLSGAFTICLIFLFSFRYVSKHVAYVVTGILWASLHMSIQFHMAVPDPYLIWWMTLSICSFFAYWKEKNNVWVWLMYVGMGFSLLTKGPVGLALPGLIFLSFLLITRTLDKDVWKTYKMIPGTLIVILISLPWYVLVGMKTGGVWLNEFFLNHNIGRYTDTMEGHGGIFLLTPLYIWVGMLPFSVFFVSAAIAHWNKQHHSPFITFCYCVVIVITVFFAISRTKLPNYTVPAYPFLAVILGQYAWDQVQQKLISKGVRMSIYAYMLLMLMLPLGVYWGLQQESELKDLAYLGTAFAIVSIGAIGAVLLMERKQLLGAMYSVGISWIVMNVVFFYVLFPIIDEKNAVMKGLPYLHKDHPIAQYQLMNPAFLFYLQKKIPVLSTPEEVNTYFETYSDAFVITRQKKLKNLDSIVPLEVIFAHRDLFERPTTVIFKRNSKPQYDKKQSEE